MTTTRPTPTPTRQIIRNAPLPLLLAAAERATAEIGPVEIRRNRNPRVCLGSDWGIGAARANRLAKVIRGASRISTGMGANAYRLFFPLATLERTAQIIETETAPRVARRIEARALELLARYTAASDTADLRDPDPDVLELWLELQGPCGLTAEEFQTVVGLALRWLPGAAVSERSARISAQADGVVSAVLDTVPPVEWDAKAAAVLSEALREALDGYSREDMADVLREALELLPVAIADRADEREDA